MHLRFFGLAERQVAGNCPIAGTTWFTCNTKASNFSGCCVDSFSCDQPTCPNFDPAPLTAASLSTASSTQSPSSSAATTATVTTTASAVFVTPSILTVINHGSTQTIYDAAASAMLSTTPSATTSPTHSPQSSPMTSATPIIAGAVSGVVALSILSILLWFCCKRRRQKKNFRGPTNKYELSSRDYILSRVNTPEVKIPKDGDVFAEFGGTNYSRINAIENSPDRLPGRHKSPAPSSMRPAPRSSFSTVPLPPAPTHNSRNIDSPIDAPIPDIEKSGLTPPPMAEHPVYHVGGSTQQNPIYNPAQEMASPPMEQHPAYHISQLSQHPAFSPRTSPRSATFPKRTIEVKRQKSSPRNGGRSGPLDITPIVPALPTGRSELPADVPVSFTSPASQTPSPPPQMRVQTSYNPSDYAPYDGRSRNNNLILTYNNPIGLGVLNSPLSASQYPSSQQASMSVVSPLSPRQQFIQQYRKQNPQSERLGGGLQVISPHSAISPESPFHLEKQYSHLSHSTSTPSPRSPFSSDLRDGTEKEVISPLSPERWSGATCLNDADAAVAMHQLANGEAKGKEKDGQVDGGKTPVETPTGLTPSDDFKTWETWAQR